MSNLPHPRSHVRPDLPSDSPPTFLPVPLSAADSARQADLFAWMADCPDNHADDYPGPGWSDPENWPLWTDRVRFGIGPEPHIDPDFVRRDPSYWDALFDEYRIAGEDDWNCPGRIG